MNRQVRSIGAVIGMGLVWAIGWGLGVGGLVELIIDTRGQIEDIWPAVLGIPAFVAGVAFGALLWLAEGDRALRDVSPVRVLALGALAGLLLGLLLLATPLGSGFPALWRRVAEVAGRTIFLSAGTAWLLQRLIQGGSPLRSGPLRA